MIFKLKAEFIKKKCIDVKKWAIIIFIISFGCVILVTVFNNTSPEWPAIICTPIVIPLIFVTIIYFYNRFFKYSFFLIENSYLAFYFNGVICIKRVNLKEIIEYRNKNEELIVIKCIPKNKTFTGEIILTKDMIDLISVLEEFKKNSFYKTYLHCDCSQRPESERGARV